MRVKSEARRQAIIDVAKEAFCRQGFEATSMSEIASRVGGSKATLYNYFRSKEEIFIAVMESSATAQAALTTEPVKCTDPPVTVVGPVAPLPPIDAAIAELPHHH